MGAFSGESKFTMIDNVALVAVTYNSEFLAGWFAQTANNFKYVFIVDNASQDATCTEFQEAIPHATIIPQNKNIGFGPANNIGLEAARVSNDKILFINPDCKINARNTLLLVDALEKDKNLGVVSPLISDASGRVSKVFFWDFSRPYSQKRVEPIEFSSFRPEAEVFAPACLDGSCFMVRTSDFMKIGGFNNDLFMYCEEDDLGLRMQHIKKVIGICLRASATHLGGASTNYSTLLLIKKSYHVRWSRFYMTDRYISSFKRLTEALRVLFATPVALMVYGLFCRRNLFLRWLGWGAAALDGIFLTKFFRRFFN